MSRKFLSLALVVVMLVSIFTVSTNAAVADGSTVGVVVTSDAKVGMKAGDTVTVTIAFDAPEGVETYLAAPQIVLGYTQEAFSVTTADVALDSYYTDYFATFTTSNVLVDGTKITKRYLASFGDYESANNLTYPMLIAPVLNGDNGSTNTGVLITSGQTMFTVTFKVLRDLVATDAIGFVKAKFGTANYGSVLKTMSGGASVAIAEANVDFTESLALPAAAAATAVVTHRANQVQWADESKTTVNLGFKGEFAAADLPIAFDDNGTSTNVTEVGAKITIGETEQTKNTRFVHEYETGKYEFRAILGGVDPADTAEIKVEYYVIMDGTTYWSDAVTTTAAAVVAASNLPA